MIEGSNRLPTLLAEIKNANVVYASAQRMTADTVIVMGRSLIEAKGLCEHGEWVDFLKSTGIPARSAQRYMRIVNAGVGSDYLAQVGLSAALLEIDEAIDEMPAPHEAMLISLETESDPDVMIWWSTGKFTGGFLQACNDAERPHRAKAWITESIPIVYLVWMLEYFRTGLPGDEPKRVISQRTISREELDAKLQVVRESNSRIMAGTA